MNTMRRILGVTLEEARKHVINEAAFGYWKARGNYMNIDQPPNGENVETWVFLGESIIILGLGLEKDGIRKMASLTDFMDIWPSVKTKYPQLFQNEVVGDLRLIP